jgi:hypothetical protein
VKAKGKPTRRPLSELDGPLIHLLEDRNTAWLALEKAKLKIEQFMAACEVIREEASGRMINRASLPPVVRALIKQINFRAAAKAVRFSNSYPQRTD